MNQHEQVKGALALKIDSLPNLPTTAAWLLQLLRDPDSDVREIEKAIRYAPDLTADVLRMANSAYFGYAGKIGSVRQAVVRLGWQRVFQVVLASRLKGVMAHSVPGYDLVTGELWRHAVAVSVAAERLGSELGLRVPEETFTAAILHDVGKIVIGSLIRADLSEIEVAVKSGLSFEEAERRVLGFDHAEAGAEALGGWHLPTSLVEAVRWHHAPDAFPGASTMVDIIHVADMLCLMLGIGVGREGLGYAPSSGATRRLGLRVETLEAVASRVPEGTEELLRVFGADSAGDHVDTGVL